MRLYTFRTTPPPMLDDNGVPIPVDAELIPTASVVALTETEARGLIVDRLRIQFGLEYVGAEDAPENRVPGVVFVKRPDGTEFEAPELPPVIRPSDPTQLSTNPYQG